MDLAATLLSGQAFRWQRDGKWFTGVVLDNLVRIRQTSAGMEFCCAPDDESILAPLLTDYLGLSADLDRIYASVAQGLRLKSAIERYWGMRILRQDPWECLMSFICSSNSNIPRISRNVESICSSFGRPLALGDISRSTFPTPATLAEAGEPSLRSLGLGYRAGYLEATSRDIADGKVDLMALREDSYEAALESLTSLAGVGDKVANCVLLFSLDKPEAFPIDVWVHRALREWYFDGREKPLPAKRMRLWAQEHFGRYAGYANQYLFHDRRLLNKAP